MHIRPIIHSKILMGKLGINYLSDEQSGGAADGVIRAAVQSPRVNQHQLEYIALSCVNWQMASL